MTHGRAVFFVLIVLTLTLGSFAAGQEAKKSEVTIQWNEFKKLLALDKDEITLSWEEFQLLLRQTGVTTPPPYTMKDEKVVLTRKQFKTLLSKMKPPTEPLPAPPAPYILTRADYAGHATKEGLIMTATFDLRIFNREKSYTKIPLFPRTVALQAVTVDGKKALMTLENGQYTLSVAQSGWHRIRADLSLKITSREGRTAFSFPVPTTPITHLDLTIPATKVAVNVENAQDLMTRTAEKRTRVSAQLSPSSALSVSWKRALPPVEKGPAKLYADTINHMTLDDDIMKVQADVTLSVLQNTIDTVTLQSPGKMQILNVSGPNVGDWREVEKEGVNFLEIPFTYPKKGTFTVTVTAERTLAESTQTVGFTGFSVVDAIRDKGFVGIELKGTSDVTVAEKKGIDKLDISELPSSLINRSTKPLLFGFKYLRHPFSLVLQITKHEEIPTISTVVDFVSGVTLFTKDGKRVHRVLYTIRNTSKQYMELTLPKGAQVWSLFVGSEPTRPRINGSKLLIPLNRSMRGAEGLASFDVELIYYEKDDAFSLAGSRKMAIPVPDILVSRMLWSIYVPAHYSYGLFATEMEKEKGVTGAIPFIAGQKRPIPMPSVAGIPEKRKDKKSQAARIQKEAKMLSREFSSTLGIESDEITQQVMNEQQFGKRVQNIPAKKAVPAGGMLPVKITIPTTGIIYRFGKTIVNRESTTIRFRYISKTFSKVVKVILLLLLIVALYLMSKPIIKIARTLPNRLTTGMLTLILLCFAVVIWPLNSALGLLFIFGAVAAVGVRGVRYLLAKRAVRDDFPEETIEDEEDPNE